MDNLMMDLIDDVLNIEDKEVWKVENDLSADWCLDKIRESRAEYNRFEIVAKEKIRQIEEKLKKEKEKAQGDIDFFEWKLREYFEGVKTDDTKTLRKYKLPSGELRAKKSTVVFDYDKNKLLEVAEKGEYENIGDYIKVKKDFDWSEFKKNLAIEGNTIVNKNTGEIIEIEGLGLVEKDEVFSVEV